MRVAKTGFTVLYEPPENIKPEFDIIFVHGLQGHPENTWTFFEEPSKTTTTTTPAFIRWLAKLFKRTRQQTSAEGQATVFWPRDLLSKHADCSKARIMTYGYNSFVLRIAGDELVNAITMSEHGQSLLHDVARERQNDKSRPLMFVAHSLGGLLVKAALNTAYLERDNESTSDLHSVLTSTFAIIFLGTPHRGSANYADFGRQVAQVAALLTVNSYNDKIIRNLAPNNEVLTNLRQNFARTYEYMAKTQRFGSSTFQEGKGLTGIPGFRGKVVDGDSSELGHRGDRQDVLDRNHRDMCKFTSAHDPEYRKVEGEIVRHIKGFRNTATQEELDFFMASLGESAKFATLRKDSIKVKYANTAEWIWTATATTEAENGIMHPNSDLKSWLSESQDQNLFWITGRPGSGKSTIMRYVLDNKRTKQYLSGSEQLMGGNNTVRLGQSEWLIIGLFITDRGAQEQRQWFPMMQGILYQLLQSQPSLIPSVMPMAETVHRHAQGKGASGEVTYNWTYSTVEKMLEYCKSQTRHPVKALIMLDGLDELQKQDDARQAVSFFRSLVARQDTSQNTFKVCVASRSENLFLDLFRGVQRVHIHEHTQQDIRDYTWDRLRENPRFSNQDEVKARKQLDPVVELICKNARGVFLWVFSIISLVDQSLADGDTMDEVYDTLARQPTEMNELYRYMLRRITEPRLRQKAYLMLETVLRSRNPPTLQGLFLIVKVAESNLLGNRTPWTSNSLPSIDDFLDPVRMQSQLLASCRCFLEIVRPEGEILHGKYENRDGTRAVDPASATVQLLHRTARDFLLAEGEEILGELLASEVVHDITSSSHKLQVVPRGNGHVYILQFVRAWWMLPETVRRQNVVYNESRWREEVLYHAPLVEKTVRYATHFFHLLDDLDKQATVMLGNDRCWPSVGNSQSETSPWRITFPAFAVKEGMLHYITHLIDKASAKNNLHTFINGDYEQPLLHCAVSHAGGPPQLAVAELLLENGANVNKKAGGKTAIEKQSFSKMSKDIYDMYRVLLEHGADPNSAYYPDAGSSDSWFPLVHLVAYPNSNEDEELYQAEHVVSQRAIDLLRLLVTKGADINKKDSQGRTLIQALSDNKRVLPEDEWEYLLRNGHFKITRDIVAAWPNRQISQSKASGRDSRGAYDSLRQPRFRKRDWYDDDGAREIETRRPGWFTY
ncbi:alpha beta-hydrolase [Cercophora samala]|uniref:Alpha beta-hydrolase n=1 Tax=Cercophora samala TaxID=330535 RepID=A0AA39Z227_9PEZI|nr:alpha beta-hydrolase [Cercophora samala]